MSPQVARSGGFSLDDYVTVAERIGAFYAKYPDGSLQSELVELNDARVVMRAYAYRQPNDERPGIGYSSLGIPGTTPYTRGSEIENCESSAWGRAIAALGFEVKRGIASAEEVRNKSDEPVSRIVPDPAPRKPEVRDDGSLVGIAEKGKGQADFELRQTPDGMKIEFRLTSGRGGIKVVAIGPLAEALHAIRDSVIGQRVSCWGHIKDESFRPKGATKDVTYQVMTLERIQTPDVTLPADEALPEPPEDVPLVGETPDSPPLFDDLPVAS